MTAVKQTWFMALLTLLVACSLASAQAGISPTTSKDTEVSTKLIDAANQYKASSKELLAIQEDAITKAEAKLDELRMLVSEGLLPRCAVSF